MPLLRLPSFVRLGRLVVKVRKHNRRLRPLACGRARRWHAHHVWGRFYWIRR